MINFFEDDWINYAILINWILCINKNTKMYFWYWNVKQKKLGTEKYVYYTIHVNMEGGKYIHSCMYMYAHLYWLLYEQNCPRERKENITMFTSWKGYRSEKWKVFHYILFSLYIILYFLRHTIWLYYCFYNERFKKASYLNFPTYSFNSRNELFVDDLYCVSTVVWALR